MYLSFNGENLGLGDVCAVCAVLNELGHPLNAVWTFYGIVLQFNSEFISCMFPLGFNVKLSFLNCFFYCLFALGKTFLLILLLIAFIITVYHVYV